VVTVRQYAAIFEADKPPFDLHSTHCIIAKSLLNLPDCFCFGISKFLAKLDAVPLLHVFSHIDQNAMQQACITAPHTLTALHGAVETAKNHARA
jgi:hypothetical protein